MKQVEKKSCCAVCGNEMNKRFLIRWNEQDVCRPCVLEMTADYPEGVGAPWKHA
ncbi:hypothetical protein [Paenibacillus maysiensis]|uniref:hypothetical protein n=1 Tax=Paenibacillus maysiensis TaxID=1155954 RepID=UPI0012DC02E5|nr:hypothetical protein [Paenibacillus maysiensis]